jgi:hypothetical protein
LRPDIDSCVTPSVVTEGVRDMAECDMSPAVVRAARIGINLRRVFYSAEGLADSHEFLIRQVDRQPLLLREESTPYRSLVLK